MCWLKPETILLSLNLITQWDVLYKEGLLCGSNCILVVLQVMLLYELRLLILQLEEPTRTEEFWGGFFLSSANVFELSSVITWYLCISFLSSAESVIEIFSLVLYIVILHGTVDNVFFTKFLVTFLYMTQAFQKYYQWTVVVQLILQVH